MPSIDLTHGWMIELVEITNDGGNLQIPRGRGKRLKLLITPTWEWLAQMLGLKKMARSFYLLRTAIRHKNFGKTVGPKLTWYPV